MMELIERYVYGVKKRLPLKTREDVGREIESLIRDELEDRFGAREIYSDEEIGEVLKELGPPYKTAGRYREGSSYLVGPELFEAYRLILMIAAGAVTLGLLISHIIGILGSDASSGIIRDFLRFFPQLFSALLSMIGAVTVVFYCIQRCGKMDLEKEFTEDWTTEDLPELPDKEEKVGLWEPIVGLFFIVLAIVLLNALAYGNLADRLADPRSNLYFIQIFDLESIRHFAPFWNVSLGLGIMLNCFLIPIGKRERKIRLMEMVINLYDITVLALMIKGPLLISQANFRGFFQPEDGSSLDRFIGNADTTLDRVFLIFIILTAIGFTVNLVKVIARREAE